MTWSNRVMALNLVFELFMCLAFLVIVIEGDQGFPVHTELTQALPQPDGWPSSHSSFRVVHKSTEDGTIIGFYETNSDSGWYELSIIWTSPNTTSIDNNVQRYQKVWSANRDNLVQLKASLVFGDGNLILRNHNGSHIWSTNITSKTTLSSCILKSGRMIVRGTNGSSLWDSCQHSTDTMLSGCYVNVLVANNATNNPSSGKLMFMSSKDRVLGLYKFPDCRRPYWTANDDRSVNTATILHSTTKQLVQLHVFNAGFKDKRTKTYGEGYGAIKIDVGDLFFLRLDDAGAFQWYILSSSTLAGSPSTSNGWIRYKFDMSEGCMYKRCSIGASCDNLSGVPFSSTLVGKFLIAGGCFILGILIYPLVVYMYERVMESFTSKDTEEEIVYFGSLPGLPPRFSAKELVIATNNFSKVIGKGGFGVVYKGILPDKSKVAVKRMQGQRQEQKQFRAEIATIGNIHHHNLVRLCGFCLEGSDQMLVYEFMAHGSLDLWLFGDLLLEWTKRFQIALDTAVGLCYLHKDCRHKIIHFDVKPHNILLDDNFRAKLADFGTSKICDKGTDEIVTLMRGTPGYCAPDWSLLPSVNENCDVYSYGMVLLEIISGRKNTMTNETIDKWYFPIFAAKKLDQDRSCKEIIDAKISGGFSTTDWDQAMRLLKIAFWCLQDSPEQRPSMEDVVHMLQGVVEVKDPPLVFKFFGLVQH